MQNFELLSPAGSFETALSAFDAGADAVYVGLNSFSARAEAVNFSCDELAILVSFAHSKGKKVYVTFNTVIDDADLNAAVDLLAKVEPLNIDGLIVQDLGIAHLVRQYFPSIPLHASTQLVAHNLESVLQLKELGFVRVVLSRELSIEEIRSITKRCGVEIEVFIHGALCYSLSGLCLFSAMEKNRSGNRGKCAYCCRLSYTDSTGKRSLPFSMRDLRLDEALDALREAGVVSLKIEGRMKSPLYVASVTQYYRNLIDINCPLPTTHYPLSATRAVSRADLETVFSRRTTSLYVNDAKATTDTIIDPISLGHLGTPIGTVKRLTKDRENRTWLRFHTSRAIEKHDGLQFVSEGSKPFGFGITDMRIAISRTNVITAREGSDVEVLIPDERLEELAKTSSNALRPGATVYCSASNAVKRTFPVPSFRPSEVPVGKYFNCTVKLFKDKIEATVPEYDISVSIETSLDSAKNPDRTENAVRKAFERLGSTNWQLGKLTIIDDDKRFAPPSILNDLRRLTIEKLDSVSASLNAKKIDEVKASLDEMIVPSLSTTNANTPSKTLKLRIDQYLPDDVSKYDEIIIAIGHTSGKECKNILEEYPQEVSEKLRLALPVFTHEKDFNQLRTAVKHLYKLGFKKWEASDLATLRLLKQCGVTDITADWTMYAFNRMALAQLKELGITRVVASPENNRSNLDFLAESGSAVEFLEKQSTPLFMSLTKPAVEDPSYLMGLDGTEIMTNKIDGLWITTRLEPTSFPIPDCAITVRTDLSWDCC